MDYLRWAGVADLTATVEDVGLPRVVGGVLRMRPISLLQFLKARRALLRDGSDAFLCDKWG